MNVNSISEAERLNLRSVIVFFDERFELSSDETAKLSEALNSKRVSSSGLKGSKMSNIGHLEVEDTSGIAYYDLMGFDPDRGSYYLRERGGEGFEFLVQSSAFSKWFQGAKSGSTERGD